MNKEDELYLRQNHDQLHLQIKEQLAELKREVLSIKSILRLGA